MPKQINNAQNMQIIKDNMNQDTPPQILIEGFLYKQGKRTNVWKKRHYQLIHRLYTNGISEYHLVQSGGENKGKNKGFINLSSTIQCTKKQDKYLHIQTAHRTLKFKLKSSEDRNAWYQQIIFIVLRQQSVQSPICSDIETDEMDEITKMETLPISLGTNNGKKRRTSSFSNMMSRTKSFISRRLSRSRTLTLDGYHGAFGKQIHDMTAQQLLDSWNMDKSQSLWTVYNRLVDIIRFGTQEITDRVVQTLIMEIECEIRENIDDLVHLMRCDDTKLIETLKICQMEQAQYPNDRILTHSYDQWIEWRNNGNQQHLEWNRSRNRSRNQTMRYKTFALILDNIIMTTRSLKETTSLEQCWIVMDRITNNVDYVNQWIDTKYPPNCTTSNMDEDSTDSFPAHYHVINFYVEKCYQRILLIVMDKLDTKPVELCNVLTAINQIEKLMVKTDKLRNDNKMTNGQMYIDGLERRQNVLRKQYTDHLAVKWLVWVYNVVQTESTKREYFVMDGIYRVHCVQDLFTMFNQVNIERMNSKLQFGVCELIGKTLDAFQVLIEADIHQNGHQFEDEYFCAIINSMGEIINMLQRYKRYMNLAFESRIGRFTKWTEQTVVSLVNKIVEDSLRKNVFDTLFTAQYFKQERGVDISAMVQTVKEYLKDFSIWFEEEWILKLVEQTVMEIVCDEYIKALIREGPSESITDLSKHIQSDVETMNRYFGDRKVFRDDVFQESWKNKYRYLEAIHESLTAKDGLVFMVHSKRLKTDELFGGKLLQLIHGKRQLLRITNLYECMVCLVGYFWWEPNQTAKTKTCADLYE